jgi:hypothetical protein
MKECANKSMKDCASKVLEKMKENGSYFSIVESTPIKPPTYDSSIPFMIDSIPKKLL